MAAHTPAAGPLAGTGLQGDSGLGSLREGGTPAGDAGGTEQETRASPLGRPPVLLEQSERPLETAFTVPARPGWTPGGVGTW